MRTGLFCLLIDDFYGVDAVVLADIINNIYTFNHFAEARMVSIEMCRVIARMANEKL